MIIIQGNCYDNINLINLILFQLLFFFAIHFLFLVIKTIFSNWNFSLFLFKYSFVCLMNIRNNRKLFLLKWTMAEICIEFLKLFFVVVENVTKIKILIE